MLTPPSLKPGDLIRVVAPSSRFDRTRFDTGINLLKTLGYKVAFRDDIVESHDYLAGDDDRRAEEFKRLLLTPMRPRSGVREGATVRSVSTPYLTARGEFTKVVGRIL